MQLQIVSKTYNPAEDHSWLGSAHGTVECDSITLDAALLVAIFTDGFVPSGTVLGKVTATGRYARYDDAATNGLEVAAGHLFNSQDLTNGGQVAVASAANAAAALYWHGEVVESKLPTNHGLDAAAKADLKHIRYV